MGEVYRAHDLQLDRDVAIKVLPARTLTDPDSRSRLLREARAAAALNHPHVCTVHEVGESDGLIYIAMEFVAGQRLDRLIPSDGLPVTQVLRHGVQIADAIAHAHDRGVLHRDLKPSNIVITPHDRAKVLDFGLAKRIGCDSQLEMTTSAPMAVTHTGTLLGTLPYLAPELLRGDPADIRSDVWALGATLYEMTSGMRPFQGRTEFEVSSAILHESPSPLSSAVPAELSAVIGRCLEKSPDRRYQAAGEVQVALETIHSTASSTQSPRSGRRRRQALSALAAVFAALVLTAFGWWRLTSSAPDGRIRSLVVLPFANLTGDAGQEYFVVGMTEALSTTFAQIGTLTVISNTSAMRYRNTDKTAPQIARELGGVDALVEGSVQRSGTQLRVVVSLIDASNDRRVQTVTYERDVANIFALYREIAQNAVREFRISISAPEQARLATTGRPNAEAYDAYLKARYYHAQIGGQEPVQTAIRYYQESIAKDPTFAEAHAALAIAFAPNLGALPADDLAEKEARRALELNPALSEAHVALGLTHMKNWDWVAAEAAFKRAIQIDPSATMAHQWYAQLLRDTMRLDEALREARRSEELDPLALSVRTMVGWVLFNQHKYDDAIHVWDAVLQLDPNYGLAYYNKGLAYAMKGLGDEAITAARNASGRWRTGRSEQQIVWLHGIGHAVAGRREQAEAVLRDLQVRDPGVYTPSAIIRAVLGDYELSLELLEKDYDLHRTVLPSATSEPWFDSMRSHPGFRALRAKMGVP